MSERIEQVFGAGLPTPPKLPTEGLLGLGVLFPAGCRTSP